MRGINPTVENVREGDVVTIEKGTPRKVGHRSMTGKWNKSFIRYHIDNGWRITRVTRRGVRVTEEGEK